MFLPGWNSQAMVRRTHKPKPWFGECANQSTATKLNARKRTHLHQPTLSHGFARTCETLLQRLFGIRSSSNGGLAHAQLKRETNSTTRKKRSLPCTFLSEHTPTIIFSIHCRRSWFRVCLRRQATSRSLSSCMTSENASSS